MHKLKLQPAEHLTWKKTVAQLYIGISRRSIAGFNLAPPVAIVGKELLGAFACTLHIGFWQLAEFFGKHHEVYENGLKTQPAKPQVRKQLLFSI